MADRKAFKNYVVFLSAVSHVVWGLCIHYDCEMSNAPCFLAHVAVHDSDLEHNSSCERIHSDSCHSESGSSLQQVSHLNLVIPCGKQNWHEETPHQHGPHCIGNCSVYLPKLPEENRTFSFSRLIASCPPDLESPAGLSNVFSADRSTGSGDIRFKKPLYPLLTILLL